MTSKVMIKALEKIIKKVEVLPNGYCFEMERYDGCVLGTFGYFNGKFSEKELLKNLFGIQRKDDDGTYFASFASKYYLPQQWKVIRLFTADIGYKLNKEAWLQIAYKTLKQIKAEKAIV